MSRAFVKDDAPDEPMMVPPRAPLPNGVPNYVTPRGLRLLREERTELEGERAGVKAARMDHTERGRVLAWLSTRIADLDGRIRSSKVVKPRPTPLEEVRFGARVLVRVDRGSSVSSFAFTIVGVDEADAEAGLVAFTSPMAVAVTGRRAGERALLKTPTGEERLEITEIHYDQEAR